MLCVLTKNRFSYWWFGNLKLVVEEFFLSRVYDFVLTDLCCSLPFNGIVSCSSLNLPGTGGSLKIPESGRKRR